MLEAHRLGQHLAPAVVELGEDLRSVAVGDVGPASESRDHVVLIGAALTRSRLASTVDVQVAGDDQRRAAGRDRLVEIEQVVDDVAVVARPGLRRRALEETAGHLQLSDPERLEQDAPLRARSVVHLLKLDLP